MCKLAARAKWPILHAKARLVRAERASGVRFGIPCYPGPLGCEALGALGRARVRVDDEFGVVR